MEQAPKKRHIGDLERVIAKNRDRIAEAGRELQEALLKTGIRDDVPPGTLREALKLYQDMRTRLLEVESIQRLLGQRHGRTYERDRVREKTIIDLDLQIREISALLETQQPGLKRPSGTPSDHWLRDDADRAELTKNLRMLDELEYPPPLADQAVRSGRTVEQEGRGFTLFSIRGPAASMDAILPSVKLRVHDIVERFSAYEIRGVLTHLRRTSEDDIEQIFRRLLATQFPEVKCILIELRSPDHLDASLLDTLERTAEKMRPGEMRTVNLAIEE